MITQTDVKSMFRYEDGKLYWNIPRQNINIGDEAGCVHKTGYRRVQINGKLYQIHRLIYLLFHGYLPKYIDHIDNNKLNNRIENLRECTQQQNNFNVKRRKDNSSGYKGVTWAKDRNKWKGQCFLNGKNNQKYFSDILECIEWLENLRKIKHKEFVNNG